MRQKRQQAESSLGLETIAGLLLGKSITLEAGLTKPVFTQLWQLEEEASVKSVFDGMAGKKKIRHSGRYSLISGRLRDSFSSFVFWRV